MTTVYVVYALDWTGPDVVAVCADKDKAEKYVKDYSPFVFCVPEEYDGSIAESLNHFQSAYYDRFMDGTL